MRIGKYVWSVYPEDMCEEEFQCFCEAVEAAKKEREMQKKLARYTNELCDLLRRAEEDGVRFIRYEDAFCCTELITSDIEAVEKPIKGD